MSDLLATAHFLPTTVALLGLFCRFDHQKHQKPIKQMKQTFQFIVFVLFLGCNLAYCQVSEVEGSYVLQEKNFLKQGQLVRFPANGINIVYEVRAKNDSTIEIKETTYLRGQVKSNQSFNARLKFKQGRIEFNEIWESGEVECYGYFAGREMVMTNKERLTNYVVSREVAIK